MDQHPVPPSEYAHRLGVDALPDSFPHLAPELLRAAEGLDATRDADAYGPASAAYAAEAGDDRPYLILWALLRYVLGQCDAARILAPEVVEGTDWPADDVLWVCDLAPVEPVTAPLLVRVCETLWIHHLPLVADTVQALAALPLRGELAARHKPAKDALANARRAEEYLDPRFVARLGPTFRRPVLAMLFFCERDNAAVPGLGWHSWVADAAGSHLRSAWDIVAAIPAHLDEHGKFRHGENILRGLIWVVAHHEDDPAWSVPVLRAIVLAGAGTRPACSPKLARTAAICLNWSEEGRDELRGLLPQITAKAVRRFVEEELFS